MIRATVTFSAGRLIWGLAVVTVFCLLAAAGDAWAQLTGSTRITGGVQQPMFITHAPGDTGRLFVVQKQGVIRIVDLTTGSLLPGNFLSSIDGLTTAGEGGLNSIAFHPNYAENGKFYAYTTLDNGGETFLGATSNASTHILEFTVSPTDPNRVTASPREILSFVQPKADHNGGWIGFSPNDGYLYISTGDGGCCNDLSIFDDTTGHTPEIGNAQDLYLEDDGTGNPARNLLGKVLRIDVDGDDFPDESDRNYAIPGTNPFADNATPYDDEIWSHGLRNPFRASFDRVTGDLWIGDVGEARREEINFQPGDSEGGENYGWRLREGSIQTPGSVGGPEPPNYAPPVYDYTRGPSELEGRAVIGGQLYRGPDPALRGMYIFGDNISENNFMFDPSDPYGTVQNINSSIDPNNSGIINRMTAYGTDADGNIYIADVTGELFRIDTAIQLPGDYDGSGVVDEGDYAVWKSTFGSTGSLAADGNGSGTVDLADYTVWRDNLGRQLPAAITSGAQTVPEPCTLALLGTALLGRCVIQTASRYRAERVRLNRRGSSADVRR